MAHSIQLRIQRNSEAQKIYGISKSNYYSRILDGLIPEPFPIGERAVGQLEHETQAMVLAMAAGFSNCDLRTLVTNLMAQRKNLVELHAITGEPV